MRPRVIYRTHYQIDEPAYMELLVKNCSSPTRSAYREVIASRLASEVRARGGSLNDAAGGYAVDLASALQLLTGQYAWAAHGHLLALCADVGERSIEDELPLTAVERLLHFRLFLEADGAALIYLAGRMSDDGALEESAGAWNALADDMFRDVFSAYLATASLTADRVAARQLLERVTQNSFRGRTGAHKLFLHLQVLARVGVITRADSGAQRRYAVDGKGAATFERFRKMLPDYKRLEEVAAAGTWADEVVRILHGEAEPEARLQADELLARLVPLYRAVADTGVAITPIATLVEAMMFQSAVDGAFLPSASVYTVLRDVQRRRPKDIRFHVDRTGRPAFLKLSRELISAT